MNHTFEQSPNGLCAMCGLSLRLCTKAQERRNQKAASETLSKQAVVFGQQIPASCQVVQMGTTSRTTAIVTTSGQVYTWGEDCLGLGRKVSSTSDAHQVNLVPALRAHFVAKISCGENHILALLHTFICWSWGENDHGQLGHGHSRVSEDPHVIEGRLKGRVVIDVVAAKDSSFASTLGGEVFMWGDNTHYVMEESSLVKESGHFGHFLPEEYARVPSITTPVQLKEKRGYRGEDPHFDAEEEPTDEDVSIAVDPSGNLKIFESKSSLEVLSATISQEAVSSMTQENADLRYRLKELQNKYDFIDYSQAEMPAKWAKNEELKTLETEIQRLQRLLEGSVKESNDFKSQIIRLEQELQSLEDDKRTFTAQQEMRWEQLKNQYSGSPTEDGAGTTVNDSLLQTAMMSGKTDDQIQGKKKKIKEFQEELEHHRRAEDTLRQQINVHNGMKFIIRKDMAYSKFDFGSENEQHRIDELLKMQEDINDLKVISAIQPPISREELEAIITGVSTKRSQLVNLAYPVPSALFDAVSKTRSVLVSHLELLGYLLHIKEVDPERRMMVDDQIMEDFSWGPKTA